METDKIAKRLKINGIVQGVGFRPFVYQLAESHKLSGYVVNTSYGVEIHIEGNQKSVKSFEVDLIDKQPLLSEISDHSSEITSLDNHDGFVIKKSSSGDLRTTMISPDVSICDDCLKELKDPADRRYGYPFINCTNCGPRYSIIEDVPYDRPKTSMKHFKQCHNCYLEYTDPVNRRFHAQPNACPECGPVVSLFDRNKKPVITGNVFKKAAELLKEGRVLAVKGLAGFHLAADAENDDAVSRLRKVKDRGAKPFAVMAGSMDIVNSFARVSKEEDLLLNSFRKPIVLLEKKTPAAGINISLQISPENRFVGVMMPYTPLHYLLFDYDVKSMVLTSGNRRGEPIAIDNDEAFSELIELADYFLVHNRDIYLRSDDSVVKCVDDSTRFFRRSRGYAPAPVFLKKSLPPVLACGGELKNTVCLLKDNKACLSQYLGDLDNPKAYDFFKKTIGHLTRILDISPHVVAHDLHPDYLSTRYAKEMYHAECTLAVQHHHAHIVSCMAENQISSPTIGLAFDGTGYGNDGNIWGGEVIIADYHEFKRLAHLEYMPMPGGEAAVKEPWRMAVSLLNESYGNSLLELPLPVFGKTINGNVTRDKVGFILQMLEKSINSPLTSSMGRLFDGISSILGLRQQISFEGQAAIELEMLAGNSSAKPYECNIEDSGDSPCFKVVPAPLIKGVVADMMENKSRAFISSRFHNTIISVFSDVCEQIGNDTGIKQVALSGGVFQNSILLSGFIESLGKRGFRVYSHTRVPSNDGGLSLGQAVIASSSVV